MFHTIPIDFVFDNTEDVVDAIPNVDLGETVFTSRQILKDHYHIRYNDEGICNIRIFEELAKLIESAIQNLIILDKV